MATLEVITQLNATVDEVLQDNDSGDISASDLKGLFRNFLTFSVDSAYAIWLEAGNVGNKAAFLAYIKGKSTYELAVIAGYVGTQAQWITAQESSRVDAANSATTATQKATIATTKATEAATSAQTATTKAAEAVTSANSAATSASTATTKAAEAVTTAGNMVNANAAALAAANNAVSLAQTANLQGVRLGVWNPLINSQGLTSDASAIIVGGFYDVVVAGTSSITGTSTAFAIGDRLAKVANVWVRIPFALADNSIPVTKLLFASAQKNLFNKAVATLNSYITGPTTQSALSGFYFTDFIPVLPSTNYATTNIGSNAGGAKNYFYDANKNSISEIGGSYGVYFTTPANCYFVRLSSSTLAQIDTAQVEQGTARTLYESYSFSIADNVIPPSVARKTDIPNVSNYVQKIQGKNLYNKDTNTLTASLDNTGQVLINASYTTQVTDWIAVNPTAQYIHNSPFNQYVAEYDTFKSFLRYTTNFNKDSGVLTTLSTTKYIRVSVNIAQVATLQIEQGSVVTAYEAFNITIADSLIPITIARKTDLPNLSSFAQKIQGKNLFNKATATLNYYLGDTGTLSALAGYYVSDFVPVLPSTNYATTANIGSNAGGAKNLFYDANKNVISVLANSYSVYFTTPGNCYFVRLSSSSLNQIDTAQVEQGTVRTTFEDYSFAVADNAVPMTIARKTDIPNVSNFIQAVRTINLFNKATATLNNYLGDTGTLSSLAGYYVSDFIPVLPATNYATTLNIGSNAGGAKNVYYDANKNVISSFTGAYSVYFTTPANCYFVRLSSSTLAEIGTAQVEQGVNRTSYCSYYMIDQALIPAILSAIVAEIVLPSTMYLVKNHNVSIYQRNIVLAQPELKVLSNNWMNYNRQCVINRTASESVMLQLIKELSIYSTKNIATIVTNPTTNAGKTANILCIGDSFTDIGTWVDELRILLETDGVTVNLIGTMGATGRRNEALSGGTMDNFILNTSAGAARIITVTGVTVPPSTGYPGITYKDANNYIWTCRGYKLDGSGNGLMRFATYAVTDMSGFPASGTLIKVGTGTGQTTINYSASVAAYFNPFWNPATNLLDFNYYLGKFSFANPTHVCIQFTWNDLSLWATDSSLAGTVAKVKTIVDAIHTQLPSAKIVFSIEPMGAVDTTYDFFGKLYSVLKFAKAMFLQFTENSSYNTFVRIAPSYAYVDLKNGYTGSNVALSSRYPAVLEAYSDGVHCNDAGMRQIGDCVYDNISSFL